MTKLYAGSASNHPTAKLRRLGKRLRVLKGKLGAILCLGGMLYLSYVAGTIVGSFCTYLVMHYG